MVTEPPVIPAAALVIASTPPPEPEDVLPEVVPVLPVPVFPLELVVGKVSGPFVVVAWGVTTAPVIELTKIGGFKPVTKPDVAFPDLTGPVSPILLSRN